MPNTGTSVSANRRSALRIVPSPPRTRHASGCPSRSSSAPTPSAAAPCFERSASPATRSAVRLAGKLNGQTRPRRSSARAGCARGARRSSPRRDPARGRSRLDLQRRGLDPLAVEARRRRASPTGTSPRSPWGRAAPRRQTRGRRARAPTQRVATVTSASRRSAAFRTTPAFTRARPSSNCGFTIARSWPSGATHSATAGITFTSEMNETSIVASAGSNGRSAGTIERALVRSITSTRGSFRSDHSSCPCATSSAITRAAPR